MVSVCLAIYKFLANLYILEYVTNVIFVFKDNMLGIYRKINSKIGTRINTYNAC